MRAAARSAAVSTLLLASLSCESPDRGASGLWTGEAPSGVVFTLTLTENEFGQVTGAGRINSGVSVFPATVTGAHAHPTIGLHIQAQGVQSMNFQGLFDNGLATMRGILNGSGFAGDSLRLARVAQSPAARITGP